MEFNLRSSSIERTYLTSAWRTVQADRLHKRAKAATQATVGGSAAAKKTTQTMQKKKDGSLPSKPSPQAERPARRSSSSLIEEGLAAFRHQRDHRSMLGRIHHLILDRPDPRSLARFYSELLGQPITYDSEDFVVVAENDTTSGLAFQLAPNHRPPTWPSPVIPQQMHLDIMVESIAEATVRVLALGARKLDGEHVFADPAGHPFCFIKRPDWAAPLSN